MALREPVHPVLFRHFAAGEILTAPRGGGEKLLARRAPLRGVAGPVPIGDFEDELRVLEHHAATALGCRRIAHVAEESRLCHLVVKGSCSRVVNGKLDDRAGLDVARRADVVRDSSGHRAEGVPLVVVVGIDDRDRLRRPPRRDKLADADELVGAKRQLR